MDYYIDGFKKYAVFEGRARRSEYWYFTLYNFIATIIVGIISSAIHNAVLSISMIYFLVVFTPALAVSIRRLHDVGKSGWMMLLSLIPIIGTIWLLILFIRDSNPGDNEYGPNPKMSEISPVLPSSPVVPTPTPSIPTQLDQPMNS